MVLAERAHGLATFGADARRLAGAALRPRTVEAYWRHLRQWAAWCEASGRDPYVESSVADYLAARQVAGCAAATLSLDATAIGLAWRARSMPNPRTLPGVALVLRGAVRVALGDNPPREAPALRRDDWIAACRWLALDESPRGRRDRAVMVIGWLAALRRSEVGALCVADLEVEPNGLAVVVRSSKTHDRAVRLGLPRTAIGAVDPVSAWSAWLQVHPGGELAFTAAASGPASGGRVAPGWLGERGVNRIVVRALQGAGVVEAARYSGHSLRAGLATELSAAGAPIAAIAAAGRWDRLDTVLRYVRGDLWSDNPLGRLRL